MFMGLFGRNRDESKWEIARLEKNVLQVESRYLEVIRREIANMIMRADPELMERQHHKGAMYEDRIRKDPAQWQADEASLTTRIKMFQDFDFVGSLHYVPYSEIADRTGIDELVEHYHDLSRMLIFLSRRALVGTIETPVFTEHERTHIRESVRRAKDKDMVRRIKEAIRLFYAYRSGRESEGEYAMNEEVTYSDAEVDIFRLPFKPSPDIEHAVVFKKSDEYGVYSFAVLDDKTYHSYARSDRHFESRQHMMDR